MPVKAGDRVKTERRDTKKVSLYQLELPNKGGYLYV